MADREDKPPKPVPNPSAFDLWLQRGLSELYGKIADEPIPPELLKLLEEDKKSKNKDKK